MNHSLEPLLADGVIDEVVARLRGGKEADVWLVRHAGEVVTAKVYKERDLRSFKNDAAYKEGRHVRNTRTQRAMDRGSRFGQAAAAEAWKVKEADALYKLHAAGLRVPRPVLYYEGVLLMELVVDAHGRPAPRLVDAGLGPEQAAQAYAELRRQVVGMLACDLIHGDLSPYNVLVGPDGPVVIDFPQVIDAAHNSQAERFLLRDLRNVHQYCAAVDPALRAAEGDGREIWRAYVRRELTPDFVPTGRPPPERRQRDAGRPPHGARRDQGRPHERGRPHEQGRSQQGQSHEQGRRPQEQGRRPQEQGRRPQEQRPGRPGGGPPPHGHGHPAHAARPEQGTGGQRRPPHDRRSAPMPEVIRVERPPRGAPSPGGQGTPHGHPGGGAPRGDAHGGGRHPHDRGRSGRRR